MTEELQAQAQAVILAKLKTTTAPATGANKTSPPAAAKTPQGCFIAGTIVLTVKTTKPIEQIKVGDTVWAYSAKKHIWKQQVVLNTWVRQVNMLVKILTNTDTIYTTTEHPFYVNGKWVNANKLNVGNSLTSFNGYKQRINRILNIADTNVTVYNFRVANYNSYCVGIANLLVHNASAKPCGEPSKRAAMRQAKRDAGIPTSQTHSNHKTVNASKSGNAPEKGTQYYFDVEGSYGTKGQKTVQNHYEGHTYPDGSKNPKPHFNNHQPEGQSGATNNHYYYKPKKG